MSDAETGIEVRLRSDVPVVEIGGRAVLVEDSRDPDAGAEVAHIAIGIGCCAPVGTGAGELFGFGVEEVDLSELGGGEFDEVVFEKVVYVVVVIHVLGREDCAFVCDVAEDGRDLDEAAGCEEIVGVVLDKVTVDHVAVWKDWVSASTSWDWHHCVILGDDFDVQLSETG